MREVITENLSPAQVLEIRKQAKAQGCKVNVTRLSPRLVEIEIIHQGRVINAAAKRLH